MLSLTLAPGQLPRSPEPSPEPTRPGRGQDPRPQPALPLLPHSPLPLAFLLVCGPQASLNSHGSEISSPDDDIRNLWTKATLSQSKLNVPLPNACEDSDMEGSSVSSRTQHQFYDQKAGHVSVASSLAWDDGDDKDSFKQELLDDHSLLELELQRGRSLGSHFEEGDVDSNTESGQCGLTRLWVSTGQGGGQDPNICWCKVEGRRVGSHRIQVSRIPFLGGAPALIFRPLNPPFLERPLLGRRHTRSCG